VQQSLTAKEKNKQEHSADTQPKLTIGRMVLVLRRYLPLFLPYWPEL
jgi:hypothetical protein